MARTRVQSASVITGLHAYAADMALRRIDIVQQGDAWVAKAGGQIVAQNTRKADLVRETAKAARASSQGTSVRIHGRDGRIQEERTYGRGADPRRSRG